MNKCLSILFAAISMLLGGCLSGVNEMSHMDSTKPPSTGSRIAAAAGDVALSPLEVAGGVVYFVGAAPFVLLSKNSRDTRRAFSLEKAIKKDPSVILGWNLATTNDTPEKQAVLFAL